MRRARQRVLFIFLAVFGRGFLQADVRSRRLVSARPYQQEVVDFFFEHASPTGVGPALRMQLVCGSGKTYIYGMIVLRDLESHPDGRSVIFVPWQDLARQTARVLQELGIRSCVMGDGETLLDPDASCVVCVYNSAHRLCGMQMRIKIVDEAHHMEGDGQVWKQHIRALGAEMEADFTATFREPSLDFRYSFQAAVKEGYLCDLQITALVLMGNLKQRLKTLVQVISEKKDWAPMLVVFNKVSHARAVAQRLPHALALDGRSTQKQRQEALEELSSGRLKALCVVGLFNEGTSIPELKTVILAENRTNKVNLQQIAMRPLRLHEAKGGLGRLVQVAPMGKNVVDAADLERFVNSLTSVKHFKPKRPKSYLWFRGRSHRSLTDDLLIYGPESRPVALNDTAILAARLGGSDQRRLPLTWLQELVDWIEMNQRLPRGRSGAEEEAQRHRLWRLKLACAEGGLQEQHLRLLQRGPRLLREHLSLEEEGQRVPVMELCRWAAGEGRLPSKGDPEQQLENWQKVKAALHVGAITKEQLVMLDSVRCFRKAYEMGPWLAKLCGWVKKHGLPSLDSCHPPEDRQAASFLRFARAVKKGQMTGKDFDLVRKVPALHERLQKWTSETVKKPRRWIQELAEWVEDHGRLPRPINGERRHYMRWYRLEMKAPKQLSLLERRLQARLQGHLNVHGAWAPGQRLGPLLSWLQRETRMPLESQLQLLDTRMITGSIHIGELVEFLEIAKQLPALKHRLMSSFQRLKEVRPWIRSLCSWTETYGLPKKGEGSEEAEQQLLAERVLKEYKKGQLSHLELQLLQSSPLNDVVAFETIPEDALEQEVLKRKVTGGRLSLAELNKIMSEPSGLSYLLELEPHAGDSLRPWLQELLLWIRRRGRLPRHTELPYRRLARLRQEWKRGRLSKDELGALSREPLLKELGRENVMWPWLRGYIEDRGRHLFVT